MFAAEGIFESVNSETDKREGKDKFKLRKSSARKCTTHTHTHTHTHTCRLTPTHLLAHTHTHTHRIRSRCGWERYHSTGLRLQDGLNNGTPIKMGEEVLCPLPQQTTMGRQYFSKSIRLKRFLWSCSPLVNVLVIILYTVAFDRLFVKKMYVQCLYM